MSVDVAVITPIAVEWNAVCSRLDEVQIVPGILPTKRGRIGEYDIVCVKSGKGQKNTAASLQQVMSEWKPRWVLLVGIAGGFPKFGVRRGDVIIAKFVYDLDFGKLEKGKYRRRPENDMKPDAHLLSWAEILMENKIGGWRNEIGITRPDGKMLESSCLKDGYVASGDKVVDDPTHEFFASVRRSLGEVHAVEMEGSGAAAVIWLEKSKRLVGWLMVRGISDEPKSKRRGKPSSGSAQRSEWKKFASNAAAAFVKLFLLNLPREAEFPERDGPRLLAPAVLNIAGPNLQQTSPSFNAPLWLSYVGQVTNFLGRKEEMRQLQSFLESDRRLAWWLITGPAGAGKSRIALELCKRYSSKWNAGFLGRDDHFLSWSDWKPRRPTLIVVDYVAGRARSTSNAILEVSRSSLSHKVRFLLLERDQQGPWWSEFTREGSFSEHVELDSTQYALPLAIDSLPDDAMWSLLEEASSKLGFRLLRHRRSEILALLKEIDPISRPLFGLIVAVSMAGHTPQLSTTAVVQAIIRREVVRWRELIPAESLREQYLNLLTLSTMVGGSFTLSSLAAKGQELNEVLPNASSFDDKRFRQLVGAPVQGTLVASLEPDLLGEYFVLERLLGETPASNAARMLLAAAWHQQPIEVSEFIKRTVSDFPDNPATTILQEPVAETGENRVHWSQLVADLVKVYGDSEDPQCKQNLTSLRQLAQNHPAEKQLQTNLAQAEFNFGTLLLQESRYSEAEAYFNQAIALSEVGSDIMAFALNNRGIARIQLGMRSEAMNDFSTVISMERASDEVRACSLNNRADLRRDDGDLKGAIQDRTEVLALPETTFNRRFIAYYRRSVEYLALGQDENALNDLESILETPDIVIEQKMNARLQRAEIFRKQVRVKDALAELDQVIDSPVLFGGMRKRARLLRGELLSGS